MGKIKDNDIRVFLCCRSESSKGLGGPVWSIRALLKQQDRDKIPGYLLEGVLFDGVFPSYSSLPALQSSLTAKSRIPASISYVKVAALSVPKFIWNLRRANKNQHKVIFHCHDFISTYLCRRNFGRRIPLLLTIHAKGGGVREVLTDFPVLRNTPISWLAKHIETSAVRYADVVAFPSNGAKELFSKEHPGLLDNKDVRIVHAGIDSDEILGVQDNKDIRNKYHVPENNFLILSIAAMVHDKGLDTLVESFALLPPEIRSRCSCLIIGREGPLKPKLESLILQNGLQDVVKILSFLPRQDMVQLLKQSNLFVLPSRVAIFDVVLLEAALAGTPIITSAVGGNLEMFNNETAFFVPSDDPLTLADSMKVMVLSDQQRKMVSQNAKIRVQTRFTLSSLAKSYVSVYQEMLRNE